MTVQYDLQIRHMAIDQNAYELFSQWFLLLNI